MAVGDQPRQQLLLCLDDGAVLPEQLEHPLGKGSTEEHPLEKG
jgi:hypothetical protein